MLLAELIFPYFRDETPERIYIWMAGFDAYLASTC